MNRQENAAAIETLLSRLRADFGKPLSEKIIQAMAETIGGMRLTFPSMKDLDRNRRNARINREFSGFNHVELAERYGLKIRQIRRILHGK
jgi:Mor family transcriptional regulator